MHEMELTSRQVQQRITVRIVCNDSTGTGILVLPESREFIYILTAKHVLFGKDFSSPLVKSAIIIDKILTGSDEFMSYQVKETNDVLTYESNEDDIAVIIISKTESAFDPDVISEGLYIDSDFGLLNCYARGFPYLGGNTDSRALTCLFDEFKAGNSNHFLIHTPQHLETFFSDANTNVQGLSGGGVFFNYDGKSHLLGVVMKYANINSFYCIRIGRVNSLIEEKGLPGIKTTLLIVDERVKKAISAFKKNEASLKTKIKDTIGNLHLTREQTTNAVDLIRQNQLLLLYGNAGVGKSSFAKETINKFLELDEFELFLFNGDQFSRDSIDAVLQSVGIDLSIDEILSNTVFKKEKIFWIESVEKLVETNQIEAFNGLLELAKKNTAIKIVVTIRSYMLQQFFLRFGWNLPSMKALLEVPLLSDDDLLAVTGHFSSLQSLVSNPKIIHLLKTPFYLNYAVAILPALNESENLDEQKLKSIIWENVIDKGIDNRGLAFETLCIKRAKEMTLFTSIEVDREIIQSLYRDNLIAVENDELRERYSPSHDVLEDWALMRFIKRHKKDISTSKDFFHAIGNEPAIRRAFRLWFGETLQNYDSGLKDFIQEAIANTEIEKYWKDEIYISILRSEFSGIFFEENVALLLENEGRLTLKFIHLLKTACKEPVKGFANSYFPILIGTGWGSIIHFLYTHKETFIKYDQAILSFLFEWKSKMYNGGVNFPPESKECGLLLLDILNRIKSNYNGNINRQVLDDYIEEGIRFSFTLTRVITQEIEQLLLEAEKGTDREGERPNYRLIEFYEKVIEYALDGIYSNQLCIYMPDIVIDFLRKRITPKPKVKKSGFYGEDRDEVEDYFGLQYNFRFRLYPPSSYQTPLYYLLKNHLVKGIDFILEIINNSTQAYIGSANSTNENVVEVEIILNDGSIVKQWGNHILWQMYRGIGRTPNFLQSILMALEKYLFELAEKNDVENNTVLHLIYDYLYKRSTSVATTAILASVGMRFPDAVGEAILPLLSSKQIIQWDEIRYMNEQATGFSLFNNENDIHERDRSESDQMAHRKLFKGLNNHIVNLLLYNRSFNEQIFKFLDAFHEEAKGEQSVLWLKSLSEIDVRKWQITSAQDEPGKVFIYPTYEGKVKEFVEEGLPQREQANIEAGYSSWIDKAYNKDASENYTYEVWKQRYLYYTGETLAESLFAKPGTLAIVGLRDFSEKLTYKEKQWSIATIYEVINDVVTDREGYDLSLQRSLAYNLLEVKPCLSFLPFLFTVINTKKGVLELKKLILYLFLSSLHDHELNVLLISIRNNLWQINQDFANRCVYFLIEYTLLRKDNTNWQDYFGNQDKNAKDRAIKRLVNAIIVKDEVSIDLSKIQLNNYTHSHLHLSFLLIPSDTKEDHLINYCIKLVQLHIDCYNEDRNDRASNFYQDRLYIRDRFSELLLYLEARKGREVIDLLFDAYDSDKEAILRHHSETKKQEFINNIIEYIIRNLDRRVGTKDEELLITSFWNLWNRLHERNQTLNSYHFASLLLLEIAWKEEARNWKPLIGKSPVLTEFIKYYGEVDLSAALALMSTIGEEVLMPQAISLITEILRKSPFVKLHLNGHVVVKFIQRCFYNHGKAIKQNGSLLNDLFMILDIMVDNGSAEAYLIRENLITFKTI